MFQRPVDPLGQLFARLIIPPVGIVRIAQVDELVGVIRRRRSGTNPLSDDARQIGDAVVSTIVLSAPPVFPTMTFVSMYTG